MAKKLTSPQLWLLQMISSGWDLYSWTTMISTSRAGGEKYKIQEGGYGKGGKTFTVSFATVRFLMSAGMIHCEDKINHKSYSLTDFGMSVVESINNISPNQ